MCGRYTIYQTKELANRYRVDDHDLDELLASLRANYNVAPGQTLPVVTQDEARHLKLYRWGFIPSWAKDKNIGYKMINSRAETVFEKPMWKGAVLKHRCLIPANGFYEWKGSGKDKRPYYIYPKDQELFSFAGITSGWTDRNTGEIIESFSILTTSPNKEMESIHDRMPVILKPSDEDRWLDPSQNTPESIADLLVPMKDDSLDMVEVSRDVNSVRNNDEHLIYPIEAQ